MPTVGAANGVIPKETKLPRLASMAAAILVAMSEASSVAAMLAVTSIGASAVFNVNDSVPAPVAAPVTEKVSVDGVNTTA